VTHFVLKVPGRKLVFPICVLLAALASATARTITVDCEKTTISNALKTLDPQASNTIKVTGICRDSIGINDFADLSIVGLNDSSQKPTIKSLNNAPIFWIVASHVQISNLTLDGGVFGVMCRDSSVCRFGGNTIQNTTGNGVNLDGADATFTGDVIQSNANYGLILTASRVRVTQVTVKDTTAGSWGPGNGIEVDDGSTLVVEQLTAQSNQGAGVSLMGNSHLRNRPWTGPFTVSNNAGGGIWVTAQSSADLSGATVTNNGGGNGGAGVVINEDADVQFWGGGTFTGNQPIDVYCGTYNGFAAAPQHANIGSTNCPNTYQ